MKIIQIFAFMTQKAIYYMPLSHVTDAVEAAICLSTSTLNMEYVSNAEVKEWL